MADILNRKSVGGPSSRIEEADERDFSVDVEDLFVDLLVTVELRVECRPGILYS